MSNKSKWSIYNDRIATFLSVKENRSIGYSDIAKKILGAGCKYRDVDLLRTYIRRNFKSIKEDPKSNLKILIYDFETSLLEARTFWTGKTYINHTNIKSEPKIITVAWKYLGDDKVSYLKWDQDKKCDKQLVVDFLKVYNSADCVVGINNNRFDNKWMNTRAAKFGLSVNTKIKSFDLQSHAKRTFKLPSYSMKYLAQYFNVPLKYSHSGIKMWEDICFGTDEAAIKEAMDEMVHYNISDIVTTEALYYRLTKYFASPFHISVMQGGDKWKSPYTGSSNVTHDKVTTTTLGTIQHVMKCGDTEAYYRISNTDFLKYVENLEEVNE